MPTALRWLAFLPAAGLAWGLLDGALRVLAWALGGIPDPGAPLSFETTISVTMGCALGATHAAMAVAPPPRGRAAGIVAAVLLLYFATHAALSWLAMDGGRAAGWSFLGVAALVSCASAWWPRRQAVPAAQRR